jgi:hypothetical protein
VTGNLSTRIKDSYRHLQLIYDFEALESAQAQFASAMSQLRIARQHGTTDKVARAQDDVAAALAPFAQAVETVLQHGFDVPAFPTEWVEALQESGMVTATDRLRVHEPAVATRSTLAGGDADGAR